MTGRTGAVMQIGVVRLDSEGRCVFVNDILCELAGVRRDQVLGSGWRELQPAEAAASFASHLAELQSGHSVRLVDTYKRGDGGEITLEVLTMPELDQQGRLRSIVATCVERGQRRGDDVRTDLPSELAELEEIYHNTPVALCVVDRQLRYVRANERYGQIVQRSPDDLIGRSMFEVIRESAREPAVSIAEQVVATGEPVFDVELTSIYPGDPSELKTWLVNIHPVHRGSEVVGAMAVLQNVTALHNAEARARERLAELESVYRNAPIGLAHVDRDMRYLRVNQVIADMNGLPIEEIVGKTYRDLSPNTADEAEPILRALVERGKAVRNLEMTARPPADPENEHVFLLNLDPVRNDAGEVVGHVSTVQDVTERKRAEQEALSRLQQLEILYENTPAAICHMDAELRILQKNPVFDQLLSDVASEACEDDQLPEPVAGELRPHLDRVLASGEPAVGVMLEISLPEAPDFASTWLGRVHPLTGPDGAVHGLITVLQDATELARRQREVEAVRDRLEEAQRVSQVGSWEWDIATDKVWWSDELYEIFGVDDRSFVPSYQYLFDAVHPDDQAKLRHQIGVTLESDKPYRIAFRIIRPDGTERMALTAARHERSKEGHPGRLIGTCQDVTELTHRPPPSRAGRRKR